MLRPDNPQQDSVFPPAYAHIDEEVQAAEARLRQLDAELERGPGVPRPAYTLGGPVEPKRRTKTEIQQEKDTVKEQAYKYVERETEAVEGPTRQDMRDNSFGRLYREEIEQLQAAEQGLPTPQQGWSIDQRQIKFLNLAKERRDQQRVSNAPDRREETERFMEMRNAPSEPDEPKL